VTDPEPPVRALVERPRPRRVVIADDHRLILAGIRSALTATSGITIVGEATTGRGAVAVVVRTKPDVALLDLRMPDGDGLWALREIRLQAPATKVIICSAFDDRQHVSQAVGEGADGYVVKTIDAGDLAAVIRQTLNGMTVAARPLAELRSATRIDGPAGTVTDREIEILRYVAEGSSNAEIAKKLWVTEQTVKFHLSNVYRKLGVKNRTEASRAALQHGLVVAEPVGPLGS
jgi:DNA-binding NarL/FixJ family response regulator